MENLEKFIKRAKLKHGERYDYSKSIYTGCHDKLTIICPIHGEFTQTANNHYRCGCNKCGSILVGEKQTSNTHSFILKARKIHGEKYDYSLVDYIRVKDKVKIICPVHGEFAQKPNNHLAGFGCNQCGTDKNTENSRLTQEEVIIKFIEKHLYTYDYSKVNYNNMHNKVAIICRKHGIFEMTPLNHSQGQNCPKCVNIMSSKLEKELTKFIKGLGLKVIKNKRDIIPPKELDIYIPSLKKAIEFNGTYWHYSDRFFVPGKHAYKSNLCREKGIKLLHIREDLWVKDENKMKNIIIKFLNT